MTERNLQVNCQTYECHYNTDGKCNRAGIHASKKLCFCFLDRRGGLSAWNTQEKIILNVLNVRGKKNVSHIGVVRKEESWKHIAWVVQEHQDQEIKGDNQDGRKKGCENKYDWDD